MASIHGVQMVGLFVNDFEAALGFYRDGLGIPLTIDAHGDYHHAEISFQNPYFHFAIFPSDGAPAPRRAHITFVVSDISSTLAQVGKWASEVFDDPRPVDYSGGGVSCALHDPDGNEVELFEPRVSS